MDMEQLVEYSLGLEELALVFGLINRKDLGQQVIAAAYDDLSPQQVEERLTAASHSLLARGLTSISDQGIINMDSQLELAVFPLTTFDYLIQLSLVLESGRADVTIHIQQGKKFTAHLVKAGVVHILTHGVVASLGKYVLDVFDEIGTGSQEKSPGKQLPVSLAVLGEVQSKGNDMDEMVPLLTAADWAEQAARDFCADLVDQKLRGTLLRLDSRQDADWEKVKSSPNRSLLFLRGAHRSWLFRFPDTRDASQGTGGVIDRANFEKEVLAFIS